jgi:ornithine cyclodeaminase/alanine dehydrogenase-like protein (mu-crystallin family)
MRILRNDDVQANLPMNDAITGMKVAFSLYSSGLAISPLRTRIDLPDTSGCCLFMPAYIRDGDLEPVVMKAVNVFPGNRARGDPTVHAAVLLIDGLTGKTLALMEGAALTAIRTGAASGLATDLLSRHESHAVAIFGTGAQARTQLEAVCTVRRIDEIRVFSRDQAHVKAFIRDMQETKTIEGRILAAECPADALNGADIVCTATTASQPVFDPADILPGTHINAIGAYLPTHREIPGKTISSASVYVDSITSALSEAGDLIIPLNSGAIKKEQVKGEIGQLILGRIRGRSAPEEITLFKSVGIAVQDAIAAGIAYRNAERSGAGDLIDW